MARPSVFVAMACYDTMKVETCLSLLNLFNKFTMHNIPAEFRTAKSPYVGHCRNLLTAGFLHSDKDFLLFVDADMQFGADSVFRMLAANYDVCCTPYRLKDASMKESYPVSFENYDKIDITDKGFVEITSGPTGLMMIKRDVFDKLIKAYPNREIVQKTTIDGKYMDRPHFYNFFDTYYDPETKRYLGEDFAFCRLWSKIAGKLYCYVMSYITHVGEFQYTGRLYDEMHGDGVESSTKSE